MLTHNLNLNINILSKKFNNLLISSIISIEIKYHPNDKYMISIKKNYHLIDKSNNLIKTNYRTNNI
jgi:hypothetical protein